MIKIVNEVYFSRLGIIAPLYLGRYSNNKIAIVAGERGRVGKLSVNLLKQANDLKDNEFFVKLYSEGLFMNDPCFSTGIFEVRGKPFRFEGGFDDVIFQKWAIKEDVWKEIISNENQN